MAFLRKHRGKVIPRRLIEQFIRREKLRGIEGFLYALQRKKTLQRFIVYSQLDSQAAGLMKSRDFKLLFHGSPGCHSSLAFDERRRRAVYATDNPTYALFIATLHLKGGRASVHSRGKQIDLAVDLDFVNGPSKILPGFVHIVPGSQFTSTGNDEYAARSPVNVLFVIRVQPRDINTRLSVTL